MRMRLLRSIPAGSQRIWRAVARPVRGSRHDVRRERGPRRPALRRSSPQPMWGFTRTTSAAAAGILAAVTATSEPAGARPHRVLIAGGGFAAVEALLALRALSGDIEIEVVTAKSHL